MSKGTHAWYIVGLVTALAGLAGCGGAKSIPSAAPSSSGAVPAAKPGSVSIVLNLPPRTASSVRRLPAYVSASTQGAKITITVGAASTTTAFAVSANANGCATSGGTTTCVLSAAAPGFGSASVAVTLLDQPPTAGSFPNTAATLATGTVAATIAEGQANVTVPLVLAAVAQGFKAGVLSPVVSGGATSQGSFVVEAADADGNLILANGGVLTPASQTVSFNLSVANAIGGVTLQDITQNPTGTPTSTLTGVNVGDTILVATSATTPQLAGIPILATTGVNTVLLRVPASFTSSSAQGLAGFAGSGLLAGVPPYATIDGTTYGNGFLFRQSFGGDFLWGERVVGYAVTSPVYCLSSVAISSIAMGTGWAAILGVDTGSDVQLVNAPFSGSFACSAGTELLSAANDLGLPYGISAIHDVASDGTNAVALFQATGSGSNGTNYISYGPLSGNSLTGSAAFGTASNQNALRSLQLTFGTAVAAETGTAGLAFRGPSAFPQEFAYGSSPVSVAADGQYVYVFDTAGLLKRCTLGAALACAGSVSLTGYNPYQDQHAMTLGPDGDVWFATSNGLLRVDPSTLAVSTFAGSYPYTAITSSGDGRIYALNVNGTVDVFP